MTGISASSPDSLSGDSLPAQPAQGVKSSSLMPKSAGSSRGAAMPSFSQLVCVAEALCAALHSMQSPCRLHFEVQGQFGFFLLAVMFTPSRI